MSIANSFFQFEKDYKISLRYQQNKKSARETKRKSPSRNRKRNLSPTIMSIPSKTQISMTSFHFSPRPPLALLKDHNFSSIHSINTSDRVQTRGFSARSRRMMLQGGITFDNRKASPKKTRVINAQDMKIEIAREKDDPEIATTRTTRQFTKPS